MITDFVLGLLVLSFLLLLFAAAWAVDRFLEVLAGVLIEIATTIVNHPKERR